MSYNYLLRCLMKREERECLIPMNDFYSIPFKKAIGGKIVVIASNEEKAIEQIKIQLKMYEEGKV